MSFIEEMLAERRAFYQALGEESTHHTIPAFDVEGNFADLVVSKTALGYCDSRSRRIVWRWNEIESFHQEKRFFVTVKSKGGEMRHFCLIDKQKMLNFFAIVRDCGEEAGFAVLRNSGWLETGQIHLIIRSTADIVPDPQNPVDENIQPFEAGYLTPAIGGPRPDERWTRYRTAADTKAVTRQLSFPDDEKDA